MKVTTDMIKACIFGHAVGDALGVPVEFEARTALDNHPVQEMTGFGTYPVPAGSWSDDTSMTLCTLDSLASGKLDYDDMMCKFSQWYDEAAYTPTDKVFDVGTTCSFAIENYQRDKDVNACGLRDANANGNGSLMRIIPLALFAKNAVGTDGYDTMWRVVSDGSALTHAHARSRTACEIYATVLSFLIDNPSKQAVRDAVAFYKEKRKAENAELSYFNRLCAPTLEQLTRNEIKSTGYVVDTLEAALWCLLTTESYRECVLKAVNLGDDTDTVAAVAGGLAGALYGYDAIPQTWVNSLQKRAYIESLCDKAAKAWQSSSSDAV